MPNLYIDPLQPSALGTWECEARNQYGTVKKQFTITANGTYIYFVVLITHSAAKLPRKRSLRHLFITVELQWLEHLWNHENMFETGLVRANECKS